MKSGTIVKLEPFGCYSACLAGTFKIRTVSKTLNDLQLFGFWFGMEHRSGKSRIT